MIDSANFAGSSGSIFILRLRELICVGRPAHFRTARQNDTVRCALWRIGAGTSRLPPAAAKYRGGAPAPARWGAHFRTVRQDGVMLPDAPFGELESGASWLPLPAVKHRSDAPAPARWGAHFRTVRRSSAARCALWRVGVRLFPIPSCCRKVQERRIGSRPMGRSLPDSVPVWGVAQSDASGSSGRPRAVRTARPGRSIARSAADHSSVPSSSTPAAAAPTA